MQKIYDFTNENVSAYKDIFDFSNARVLTVLGSGDQYFTNVINLRIEKNKFYSFFDIINVNKRW